MGEVKDLDARTLQLLASSLIGRRVGILSDADRHRIFRIIITIIAFLLRTDLEVDDRAVFTTESVTTQ